MKIYTTMALCEEVGATYRQVHYWTERGFLKPLSIKGEMPTGTGSRRIYAETEVAVARALARFNDFGTLAVEVRRAVTTGAGHVPGTGLTIIPTPTTRTSRPSPRVLSRLDDLRTDR